MAVDEQFYYRIGDIVNPAQGDRVLTPPNPGRHASNSAALARLEPLAEMSPKFGRKDSVKLESLD